MNSPLNHLSIPPKQTPIVILSEGCFGEHSSKTATGVIRYGEWPVLAVIDSTRAGQTVRDITGMDKDIPVVRDIHEALQFKPKALLLGTAPPGGRLPESWLEAIKVGIQANLHIISGLHTFLTDFPELVALAKAHNVLLWNVRDPDHYKGVGWSPVVTRAPRLSETKVITMVGSDCAVGKKFTALELFMGAKSQGKKAAFMATGQTGIMISGRGVPLDRVVGDFMAGYTESCIQEIVAQDQPEWLFVEGQGSLVHPSYSSVTLALLHGSNPDALILCHNPELEKVWGGFDIPIPSLGKLVQMYEEAISWIQPLPERHIKVVGIALNCSAFSNEETARLVAAAEEETGLPAADPLRQGVSKLLGALDRCFNFQEIPTS